MDFSNLLDREIPCACGKTHYCPIRHVLIEEGALGKLGGLLGKYQSIILVADRNTYAICGDEAEAQIGARLENRVIFEGDGYLVPDESSIAVLDGAVSEKTDLLVGVGSGVINDLCKYVSYQRHLPYYIVATAPSMDGYASVGAAMIIGNMKISYDTHIPEVLLADTEVLRNAPMDMIQSGYGDIIGKYSCLNDWKLAALVRGEYYCDRVYDLIHEVLITVSGLGEGLLRRDGKCVKALMEALVCTGIAISYAGNSRPASGSEHHMSHFFEVTGILENKPYFLHGLDVVYSTIITQRLREELIALKTPVCRPYSRPVWEEKMRTLYTAAADNVIALQDETGWYDTDWQSTYSAKWDDIRGLLCQVPSSEHLEHLLNAGGLTMEDFVREYGEERIRAAALYAKDLKNRYTVLWPYWSLIGEDGHFTV